MTNNQQLAAHCRDVIANPQDHLDWVVDMARVALASLEAKPVAYADSKAIIRMLEGGTRFFTAFPETSKTKIIPVFIYAPVTAMKFPGFKSEDINFAAHRIEAIAWNRCIKEFKRLNGVES